MSNNNKLYLVALALGPVQDFIAAARRTRDLWFGSFLLSEISKAAAYNLYEHSEKGQHTGLIFPATEHPDEDLKPCETNLDENQKTPFNVPNKILAVIKTNDPKAVLKEAKKEAQKRWEELAGAVFDEETTSHLKERHIDGNIWGAQLDDLLELFAVWVVYDPRKNEYEAKRKRLEQLLAARKNSRNFKPSTVAGDRIPKSSLDGLRESVISDAGFKPWEKLHYGLSDGEQLDCPGLVKRLGGDPKQFTPLSRIAVDPWLRSPSVELPAKITKLLGQISKTELGLVSEVRGWEDCKLQFDGQLLYPFRIDAELAQINKLPEEQRKGSPKLLEDLKEEIKKLTDKHKEPSPYVAILAADGDRMGELINAATNEEQHRDISKILSNFAKTATTIMQNNHGQLIYAGGDDVLAIVPLDKILGCAKELAGEFKKLWPPLKATYENLTDHNPTLSVGIGISHMLTPMGSQLELARDAEQVAKANRHKEKEQRKNGLAIIYQPRSGDRIEFREQWSANPEDTLAKWQELHESRELPYRAAFQLRELGRVIGDWCTPRTPNTPEHPLLPEEIRRVLERKRIKRNEKVELDVIDAICKRGEGIGLEKLADELILTQRLAKHTTFKNNKEKKEPGHV
ncbi:MAG: type III-B CRISPR-associated protein Cas10/Cmr2 [Candidatus Thiodiazotropha sp. (ex Lucinoma borealis)]|nr:type III-B CRISPR-associated protein Cas10/Cmr2 [Candidatus Thiodiazotropha sp. (ex Lucinoma borealis)]